MLTPREADRLRAAFLESEYAYFTAKLDRFLSEREGGSNLGNKTFVTPGEWVLSMVDDTGFRFINQATIDRVVQEYTAAGWSVTSQFDTLFFSAGLDSETAS